MSSPAAFAKMYAASDTQLILGVPAKPPALRGKEEQRRKRALIFIKNRSKRYKACSDEGSVDKKDTQSCNKKTNCEPSAAGRSWRGGAKRT